MTVYVDDMKAGLGRMVMCHMIADSQEELLTMADRIGVQLRWHQYPGTYKSHFDIALSKRSLAVAEGAVQITWRQCGAMTQHRKVFGTLGTPEGAMAWRNEIAEAAAKRAIEAVTAAQL